MVTRSIPLAAMERVLKKAGAARVSDCAKEALRKILEQRAEELANTAANFAKHAKRSTIKTNDVKLANKLK